jgi:hypothetical protein
VRARTSFMRKFTRALVVAVAVAVVLPNTVAA